MPPLRVKASLPRTKSIYYHHTRALHWVPIPMPMPAHAHGFWVGMSAILLFMGGHGCDIIGNIIGNVIIFEYMGAI